MDTKATDHQQNKTGEYDHELKRDIGEPRYGDLVHWRNRRVDPFQALYVQVDDTIRLVGSAPSNGVTFQISLRYMTADGRMNPEFYSFTVNGGNNGVIKLIPGSEGWLVSMTVGISGNVRGSGFIMAELQRGQGSGDQTMGQLLLAGYPGTNADIGFPQTPTQGPTDGRGFMRSIAVANPGAGADWTTSVPGTAQWILRGVVATLVTSATVATRQAALLLATNVAAPILVSAAAQTQAASLTDQYSWFNGANAAVGTPVVNGGLPAEIRLYSNFEISSQTANRQAGDQWQNITLYVEEFMMG